MAPRKLSPLSNKAIHVRPVTTDRELKRIQQIRYQICVVECGQTYLEGTCHHSKTIADHLDQDLNVFSVFCDDELVGTVRWGLLHWSARPHRHTKKISDLGFGNSAQLGVTDRLALAPKARSLTTLRRIYEVVAMTALDAGSRYEFCWASSKLAALYALLGYRRTGAQVINRAGKPLEVLQLDLHQSQKPHSDHATFYRDLGFPFPPRAA